ncbi:hypothetical protein D3C85_1531200 [compost metagenome]
MVAGKEQLVAGLDQVLRHGQAHDAGADKSDVSHGEILVFLLLLQTNGGLLL